MEITVVPYGCRSYAVGSHRWGLKARAESGHFGDEPPRSPKVRTACDRYLPTTDPHMPFASTLVIAIPPRDLCLNRGAKWPPSLQSLRIIAAVSESTLEGLFTRFDHFRTSGNRCWGNLLGLSECHCAQDVWREPISEHFWMDWSLGRPKSAITSEREAIAPTPR